MQEVKSFHLNDFKVEEITIQMTSQKGFPDVSVHGIRPQGEAIRTIRKLLMILKRFGVSMPRRKIFIQFISPSQPLELITAFEIPILLLFLNSAGARLSYTHSVGGIDLEGNTLTDIHSHASSRYTQDTEISTLIPSACAPIVHALINGDDIPQLKKSPIKSSTLTVTRDPSNIASSTVELSSIQELHSFLKSTLTQTGIKQHRVQIADLKLLRELARIVRRSNLYIYSKLLINLPGCVCENSCSCTPRERIERDRLYTRAKQLLLPLNRFDNHHIEFT